MERPPSGRPGQLVPPARHRTRVRRPILPSTGIDEEPERLSHCCRNGMLATVATSPGRVQAVVPKPCVGGSRGRSDRITEISVCSPSCPHEPNLEFPVVGQPSRKHRFVQPSQALLHQTPSGCMEMQVASIYASTPSGAAMRICLGRCRTPGFANLHGVRSTRPRASKLTPDRRLVSDPNSAGEVRNVLLSQSVNQSIPTRRTTGLNDGRLAQGNSQSPMQLCPGGTVFSARWNTVRLTRRHPPSGL